MHTGATIMRHAKVLFKYFMSLTAAAVIAAPARVHGWNPMGHSVVAYIAYKNLTKEARSTVDKLLTQHFDYYQIRNRAKSMSRSSPDFKLAVFMRAATWADDIKSDPRFLNSGTHGGNDESGEPLPPLLSDSSLLQHRSWHFIDMPFSPDGTPLQEPTSPNLLDIITRLRRELDDPHLPAAAQAYDLVWLIHLVGDIHQPLHCTTRFTKQHGPPVGDAGGNLFQITYKSQSMTLHYYWDALLGTSLSMQSIKREGDLIMKRPRPAKQGELSERVWVQESFDLARGFAYNVGGGRGDDTRPPVTDSYDLKAKRIASDQVALAGYRLAAILNERF